MNEPVHKQGRRANAVQGHQRMASPSCDSHGPGLYSGNLMDVASERQTNGRRAYVLSTLQRTACPRNLR